jgi:hypothetical protein
MTIIFVYALLELPFSWGVWRSSGARRSVRITGILLAALAVVDLTAYFFPMHVRGAEMTLTDVMHIIMTSVTVLLLMLIVGFGAPADGMWFRVYSYVTLLFMIVGGALAGMDGARMAEGLPTPWMGVTERVNIYGYMLWIAMLALVLWRAPAHSTAKPPAGIGSPQFTPR